MPRILRLAKIVCLGLIAAVALVLVALLVFRAYRRHEVARALAIHSPRGIDEAMYVRIGGIDQWLRIRGQDRDNPVILCLHGGPGGTWSPFTSLFVSWEQDFTVVQWDQRGAGKTLESTGASIAASMSIPRMTEDGLEVADFLRTHLHHDTIILLGHSWGSILGVDMVRRRPDLFAAYVGTGQVSSMPKSLAMGYAETLRKARAGNDARAVQALERIGPPPFDRMDTAVTYFGFIENGGAYEAESDQQVESSIGPMLLASPEYSLWDIYNRFRGFLRVPTWSIYQAMLSTDLPAQGLDFKVPMFFFQGAEDEVTLPALAEDYLARISAPTKTWVLLPGAGHFAVWADPDAFHRELSARVRPLALPVHAADGSTRPR